MSYTFGQYELDAGRRELRRETSPIPIEPQVFDVLHFLIENRDHVVTKDELIKNVWAGRFISDSAVSTAIKAARQAVGDDGRSQHSIRTMHGRGFRFVADLGAPQEQPVQSERETAPASIRNNLRRIRRPLIGRETECATIGQGLHPGSVFSIIGPGGAGKSALALTVATNEQGRFPGGVWFCELAPVQEGQVESAVLGAIDKSAGAGPVNAGMIVERFGDDPTLLILDNCEHVIDAAARLTEKLIELAPKLTILTTSREALEVSDEKIMRLGGLDYSEDSSVAVELFLHCAQQVTDVSKSSDTYATIRQITARLDGLPLAIELAAPRLASSTPSELLHALDDQLSILATRRKRDDVRHSAMDVAIAWSYDLLDGDEQVALNNLSIFSGAFTAQAAEAICGTAEAPSLLHNLVGQSMVAFLPGKPTSRFRLLEPIRQFSRRQLDGERLELLGERHANWFATRVTNLARDMRGSNEIEACEALTAEWSDFGRSLSWGRDNRRADIAVEPLLALHIHLLWQLRIEAFGWLEAGVAACDLPPHVKARGDLVRAMGAWSGGDLDRSEVLMEACIANGGNTFETDYFQFYQGFAREDFEKVFQFGEAAWRKAAETDDTAWQITTTAFLACGYAMHAGDAPEIPGLFKDIEALQSNYPWPSGRCCELIGRTVSAFGRGDPRDVEMYRTELEHAANRCYAPWFKVTAAGIEASRTREATDATTQLAMYTKNLKSAITTGDVIQLPTILRAVAICLVSVEQHEMAAKLSGLIPSIRGLGEKGSLAPGYEDAVVVVKSKFSEDDYRRLAVIGQGWQLLDVVDELEAVVAL